MMPLDQMRTSCRAAISEAEKQEPKSERFNALMEVGSALADLISGSLQRAYARHDQRDLTAGEGMRSHGPMCPVRAGGECLCGVADDEDETGDGAGFPVPGDREDFHADG